MNKVYIIYAEEQDIGVLIVTNAPDRTAAERKIDRIIAAGGSIHKVISGIEFTSIRPRLVLGTYPDEPEEM